MLYFLSRTREYLADEFSARVTSPQDLANGLIKIAYGIVTVADTDSAKRLLNSTRHLGIVDVKHVREIGTASYITNHDPRALAEVMVFDRVNPWAKILELSSTHPLTGKRLDRLSDISKEIGKPFVYDIDAAVARLHISTARLYQDFFISALMYFAPGITLLISLLLLPLPFIPAAFGIGLIMQILYKYPLGSAVSSTILDMMRDPYASPARGKPVKFAGQVIGRGEPGYVFSEDMMYQDKTGLIFLDYNSMFGFIGNFFFALRKIKTLFSIPSVAEGWFFRGMGSSVTLRAVYAKGQTIRSHPIIWKMVIPIVLIAVSVYLVVSGFTVPI
jgi:hypothetical protein